ncbi:hypothetical protein KC360_g7473 [Hortaea werneckii]|nr:hypothetical protein KC325_g7479 [Hortaea werneckii]KAI6988285.1 hypothetical protein KC359_g7833 [Hortaea werneckii]KAI7169403.1 hypothetical protein KC360_g7473 [Hortaea werneckii]
MGDPFCIAVGALQVAEVGFKLCDTLHSSVRDFKNAERDVKRVANEVKTASWALKQLGALLQQDEAIKRTKPGAISEASTALNQCSEAFAEVQIILPASGGSSASSLSVATRLKWATRKSKVNSLLANLERLKTTLVLVFKVISYAKEIACSPKDSATDQMDLRFQLETLIKSKNEAVRRYEELSLNAGLNFMALPSNHAPPTQGNANVKSSACKTDTGDEKCEKHDLTKGLTEALVDCYKAASGLSECLHIVHIQWRAAQKYDGNDIWENYRLTNKAMRALEVVQAVSPEAAPSLTAEQSQALRQQAHEQIEPTVQQKKKKSKVQEFPLAQIQHQESLNPNESTQVPAAAASEGKKNLIEPQEARTPNAADENSQNLRPPEIVTGDLNAVPTRTPGKSRRCGPPPGALYRRRGRSPSAASDQRAGQVCIEPLWEEERPSRRQILGQEGGAMQTHLQTRESQIKTGLTRAEQKFLGTDHGLPTVLMQQYPTLALVPDARDVSNAPELFNYPMEKVSKDMNTRPAGNRDTNDVQPIASPGRKQPRAIIRHGNLFTAEEPLLDSFTKGSDDTNTSGVPQLPPFRTLSPPISPEAKTLPSFHYPAHDATLYPEHPPSEDSDPGSPLFSSVRTDHNVSVPTTDLASAHVGATPASSSKSPKRLLPPLPKRHMAEGMAERKAGPEHKRQVLTQNPLPSPHIAGISGSSTSSYSKSILANIT